METKTTINERTKDEKTNSLGVVLSLKDAEEYRTYIRRKKQTEITDAIADSAGTMMQGEDVQRVCERAVRLKQIAVKLPLSKINQAVYYLAGSKVKIDCAVGVSGETLAKVKAFEARQAVKRKAGEITLYLTPSLIDSCRYGEIRKEIRRVKRAVGKADLKVRVEHTQVSTPLCRVARIACEEGAKYFSVPYFTGCERFRMDLTGGCKLEITGVEDTQEFKRLKEAGVGRIVTDHAWEIYSQWQKDAELEIAETFARQVPPNEEEQEPVPVVEPEQEQDILPPPPDTQGEEIPQPQELPTVAPKDPETEYCCRLVGTELKFM